MLKSFFKLDSPFETLDEAAFSARLAAGSQVKAVLYQPDNWPQALQKISNINFSNVSFAKTKIQKVTFSKCTFEDCLFIGTQFDEVEFHLCSFKNCNFYKVEFQECYLDPLVITFDRRYKKTAANVGVQLFQTLLDNSSDMHQAEFSMYADIGFREWKRAQINYDLTAGKISFFEAKWKIGKSLLYQATCGFGYRPLRFFVSTVLLFLFVAFLNHSFLRDQLSLAGGTAGGATVVNFADSIFYSFSILTILGFSTVTPSSDLAKIVTVAEALCSIGWLGIFTSIFVKRFTR